MADFTFTQPDPARYPCLQLAIDACRHGQGATTALNAANEIAVEAFLNKQIRFDQIHHVNEATLDAVVSARPASLDDLLSLDRRSREAAREAVARLR